MFIIVLLCRTFYVVRLLLCFFFFKQKTAYEMRISDWSSDVCSSDLGLFRSIRTPVLLAFSTASSEAAYPKTMEELEKQGVNRRIVSFVLPAVPLKDRKSVV